MNSSLVRTYREADRVMVGVAWALFVLSMALASWYSTWTLALTIGTGLASLSTLALVFMSTRRVARVINGFVLIAFSALLIHQAHGMIEMHFFIFVLLAFLLYYRDWLPLVTGAAVAALHHFLFFFLQSEGAPFFLFNHAADISMVFIHAAFVVAETTLLVYMAVRSRREALDADVSTLGSRASANGDIDLSIVKGSAVGKSAQDFEDFLLGIGSAVAGTRIVATEVHSTSQLLGQVTEEIRVNADETSSLASLASGAAETVSRNIGVVANGSEQLQNSMHSISSSANEASRVAKSAVEIAESTNLTVGKLGDSSEQIGEFVKVIASIAQQTNLLALNATIEAARAGDAGKGFAVVANEVKELAKATAKATEEIGKKIQAIRTDTLAAVTAINEIGKVINQINQISNTITSAVELQIATTREVTRNVGDAASSATDIAANMSRVVQAAQNTTSRIGETQDASRVLAVTASKLEDLVGKFKLQAEPATQTLQVASAAAGR